MNNEQLSGYNTISILLIKSEFERERQIDFTKKIDTEVGVTIETGPPDETHIVTTVIFSYNALIEGKVVLRSEITMTGNFEIVGTPSIPPATFAELNAPATIFPFIREHLAGLSMKSGFKTIFLPPFNLAALAKVKPGNPAADV